jgi:hypothetical protein
MVNAFDTYADDIVGSVTSAAGAGGGDEVPSPTSNLPTTTAIVPYTPVDMAPGTQPTNQTDTGTVYDPAFQFSLANTGLQQPPQNAYNPCAERELIRKQNCLMVKFEIERYLEGIGCPGEIIPRKGECPCAQQQHLYSNYNYNTGGGCTPCGMQQQQQQQTSGCATGACPGTQQQAGTACSTGSCPAAPTQTGGTCATGNCPVA